METDCIYREKAIETAFDVVENSYDEGYQRAAYDIAKGLNAIPAADVRPVTRGRWNRYVHDKELWGNYCSACNTYLPPGMDWEPNFCPSCGADMRGDQMIAATEQEATE